jgi:4-hydroxybenzoate polyprenyltransferase
MFLLNAINQLLLFKQSLFAMPWIAAAFFFTKTTFSIVHVWIILAFFSARSSGMAFNRLIDEQIDAKNPRTVTRPLQAGIISKTSVEFIAFASTL